MDLSPILKQPPGVFLKACVRYFLSNFYFYPNERYDIETLTTDRVLNKDHFYWKIMQKICTIGYSQTPF